jgi:hypothetical protein
MYLLPEYGLTDRSLEIANQAIGRGCGWLHITAEVRPALCEIMAGAIYKETIASKKGTYQSPHQSTNCFFASSTSSIPLLLGREGYNQSSI